MKPRVCAHAMKFSKVLLRAIEASESHSPLPFRIPAFKDILGGSLTAVKVVDDRVGVENPTERERRVDASLAASQPKGL